MSKIQLSKNFIKSSCKLALNEDLYPSGDITSELIDKNIKKKVKMICNQNGILGGIEFAKETFKLVDNKLNFKNTDITCSDLSEEYLNVAKQKLKKFKDLKYVNCKGEELPFENESFDVLTSTYMFHEIPTEIRKKVFSEISRVLKKDGIFVLTDSLQIDDNPKLNPLLEFFPYSTHEPFYPKYIREDLKEVAKNYGLEMYYNKNAYLSKSMAFKKL